MSRQRVIVSAATLIIASQAVMAVEPVLPAASPHDGLKNRIISIDPNNPGTAIAMKVELVDRSCSVSGVKCHTDADCDAGNICMDAGAPVMLGWVSDPVEAGGDAPPSTWHSVVQPTKPDHRIWSETVVHIADCEIAPMHTYRITAESADAEGVFSISLNIGTIFRPQFRDWGDVVGPFNGVAWTEPDGLANIQDIVAIVKFLIDDQPPLVTAVNLAGPAPSFVNWNVTVTDLQLVLNGFLGFSYPPTAFTLDSPAYPADGDVTQCPQEVLSRGDSIGETGARSNGSPLVLEFVPVSATSPSASIVGNEITLVPGEEVQVELDAFLSGWGSLPSAPLLSAIHVTLDGSSLLGINATPSNPDVDLLTPVAIGCDNDVNCATGICDFPSGGFCADTLPAFIRQKICSSAPAQMCGADIHCPEEGSCIENPELALQGCNALMGPVLPANGDFEWFGACVQPSASDPGTRRYVGSLRVIVPANAAGIYTVSWRAGEDRSFANDQNVRPMPAPALVPAVIRIRSRAAPAPHDIQKNRVASFAPNYDGSVAFRVELLDLACGSTGKKCSSDADCLICDGGVEAGEPCSIDSDCAASNCVGSGDSCVEQSPPVMLGWVSDPVDGPGDSPVGTFVASVQKTMPALRQWPESVVHLSDCEIGPVETYGVSATTDGINFASPLVVATTPKPQGKFWADLVGSFDGTAWSKPNFLVNVDDVVAMMNFLTLKPAPHITVVDLAGSAPTYTNFIINATDLQMVLEGFGGMPWPPAALTGMGYPADGDVTQCP